MLVKKFFMPKLVLNLTEFELLYDYYTPLCCCYEATFKESFITPSLILKTCTSVAFLELNVKFEGDYIQFHPFIS